MGTPVIQFENLVKIYPMGSSQITALDRVSLEEILAEYVHGLDELARLEALGARVTLLPAIRIAPVEDPAPLDAAIAGVNIQELDPKFEPCYCNRIITYAEMGQHDTAEQMFYLAQQLTAKCPNCSTCARPVGVKGRRGSCVSEKASP